MIDRSIIDALNGRVTNAICRAEAMPRGSRRAREAFYSVSLIEESIANIVPPNDIEGEIARIGAVTASLDADDTIRAMVLIKRYLAENIEDGLARELHRLETKIKLKCWEDGDRNQFLEDV